MITQIVLAIAVLAALFVFFLVLSKTTGSIDNSLYKLEYLLRKECDIKLEALETKYKMKANDKKFDEAYGARHIGDVQKAIIDGAEVLDERDGKPDGGAKHE